MQKGSDRGFGWAGLPVIAQVVERIEVRGEAIEGRERLSARLLLRANLTGALPLGLEKSSCESSGGRKRSLREAAHQEVGVGIVP